MRAGTTDGATGSKISGDTLIGELIANNTILLPIPLDPHGRWGPMFENFLFHNPPKERLEFLDGRPNAARMYSMATNHPWPLGTVPTVGVCWKTNKTRKFFGHSYTAPTPKQHILQQLGLVVTKSYALLMRNAYGKVDNRPTTAQQATPPQPSPGPPGITHPHSSTHHAGALV